MAEEPRKVQSLSKSPRKRPRSKRTESVSSEPIPDQVQVAEEPTTRAAEVRQVTEEATNKASPLMAEQVTGEQSGSEGETHGHRRFPPAVSPVQHNDPRPATTSEPATSQAITTVPSLSDDYAIQCYFDRSLRHFVAESVEFPLIKVSSNSRTEAVQLLEKKLSDHILGLKKRGGEVPEAVFSKRYPEKLEVSISQGLYRKLALCSRQERVGFDQLMIEILSSGLERRSEPSRNYQRPQQTQGHQQHHNSRDHRHHQHQQPMRRRPMTGRSYHETMDNRENFLEYVRSLEKDKWRKR